MRRPASDYATTDTIFSATSPVPGVRASRAARDAAPSSEMSSQSPIDPPEDRRRCSPRIRSSYDVGANGSTGCSWIVASLAMTNPVALSSQHNPAQAYLAAGRAVDAIALHEATLKLRESRLGPNLGLGRIRADLPGPRDHRPRHAPPVDRRDDLRLGHAASAMGERRGDGRGVPRPPRRRLITRRSTRNRIRRWAAPGGPGERPISVGRM